MNETQVISMYIMYYIIQIDKQDNKNELKYNLQYNISFWPFFVVFAGGGGVAGPLPQHKQVCLGTWVVCAQNMLFLILT